MIIIPGTPQVQETRHSRELGKRIEQVVRDYQRDHPDTSLSDVRIALIQLTPGGRSPEVIRRKSILAALIAAIGVGVFTVLASNGGRIESNPRTWPWIGVVAAVGGALIAAVRLARRN